MMRKVLVLVLAVSTAFLCLNGCKKKTSEPEAVQEKTIAEYKAEAEKQIDKKNMLTELDKLESEIEKDAAAQQ